MDRTWYVGRVTERILLIHTPTRRRPGSLAPEDAAFRASSWFGGDAAGRQILLDILDALGEPRVRTHPGSLEGARDRVREALARGELAAFAIVEKLSGGAIEKPPEAKTKQDEEKHFIEFEFTYPDGSPVTGLAYELAWPDGHKEPGKLGGDGLVTRDDVPTGGYAVIFPEVESVRWERSRACIDDEVKIRASVSGFKPGAAAKVLVYREHKERPGDEIAKLSGTVKDDVVEVAFTYADHATDAQKREEGILRFIAEVSLDGGQHWGKTPGALEIEMPTITTARWSTDYAEDGDAIEIGVTVLGIPDGTPAKLDVYRFHDKGGGDDKVKSLDAKVEGGRVEGACTYGSDGDLSREGEYYFEVRIEGGAPRKSRSSLLWCTDACTDAV